MSHLAFQHWTKFYYVFSFCLCSRA